MKPAHRVLGLALLLAGIAFTSSGCVVVPVGRGYGYRPAYVAPAPIVLAPAPVVVRRYQYW
jgi:hypothetical protein